MKRFLGTLAAVLLVLDAPVHNAQADIISLGPTGDANLVSVTPNGNYGGNVVMQVGTGTALTTDMRSVLRFDVSPLVAAIGGASQLPNLRVDSITLSLYSAATPMADWNAANLLTLNVGAITADNRGWVEGTGTAGTGQIGSSSYNYKVYDTATWTGGAGLATAGTSYNSTLLATTDIAKGDLDIHDQVNIAFSGDAASLTSLIAAWADDDVTQSRANPGLVMFRSSSALSRVFATFSTREGTSGETPQLLVDYTVVPEPCGLVLVGFGLLGLLAYAWRTRR